MRPIYCIFRFIAQISNNTFNKLFDLISNSLNIDCFLCLTTLDYSNGYWSTQKEILYTNCLYKVDFSNCSGIVDYTVTTPIHYILSWNGNLPLCILTHIVLSMINGWIIYCSKWISIIALCKILEMLQFIWWRIYIELYLTSCLFVLTVCSDSQMYCMYKIHQYE